MGCHGWSLNGVNGLVGCLLAACWVRVVSGGRVPVECGCCSSAPGLGPAEGVRGFLGEFGSGAAPCFVIGVHVHVRRADCRLCAVRCVPACVEARR